MGKPSKKSYEIDKDYPIHILFVDGVVLWGYNETINLEGEFL